MVRPIAIGLAPNLEFDDILLSLCNIVSGKIFEREGETIQKLKKWFSDYLGLKTIYLFNSGRSALYLALSSLKLTDKDEVIVQAFTCVAVPNSVIWTGAKPIYVDIDNKNLNIDPDDLRKKISKNTKAIIIQHTFGIPANLEEILKIAKEFKLVVIEDCAHSLKIKYKNKNLGSFGDMTVFSFGRDKAVSSVFGGALAVNNQKFIKEIEILNNDLLTTSVCWDLKQYLHSIIMFFVLMFYNFLKFGKIILYLSQKLNLVTPPVFKKELKGKKPKVFPKKMSEAIAVLVMNQLKKIDRFNQTREKYCRRYNTIFPDNSIKTDNYPLIRYPVLIGERDKFIKIAKEKKMIFGKWYSHVIDPFGVDLQKVKYFTPCPTAENVAQYIINLPVYPTLKETDLDQIILLIKEAKLRVL
ncbi:MAG: aminotransferase class I/II-fold pyridoxal phosphate-dependent enzyme [Patescibacteria group bacterium]|nr:aminotransferase class I/II-fold pyridoxal phosphate-dependent enzyme [Patescibacteria group bacterium]